MHPGVRWVFAKRFLCIFSCSHITGKKNRLNLFIHSLNQLFIELFFWPQRIPFITSKQGRWASDVSSGDGHVSAHTLPPSHLGPELSQPGGSLLDNGVGAGGGSRKGNSCGLWAPTGQPRPPPSHPLWTTNSQGPDKARRQEGKTGK